MKPLRSARALLVALLAASAVVLAPSIPYARADEHDSPPNAAAPAEQRAQQFQRVEGPQTEQIAAAPLLVGAYAAIWILLFGYLALISRRQAATRAELDRLERLIAAQSQAHDAAHQKDEAVARTREASEASSGTDVAAPPAPAAPSPSPSKDAQGGETERNP